MLKLSDREINREAAALGGPPFLTHAQRLSGFLVWNFPSLAISSQKKGNPGSSASGSDSFALAPDCNLCASAGTLELPAKMGLCPKTWGHVPLFNGINGG